MTSGESGWDVFMLGYFVSTPLTSVITDKQIDQYRKLFRLLWALRGVDYGLKDLWKQRLALDLASLAEMRPVWHAVSLIHAEMTHLLNELQYYLIFEVRRLPVRTRARALTDGGADARRRGPASRRR